MRRYAVPMPPKPARHRVFARYDWSAADGRHRIQLIEMTRFHFRSASQAEVVGLSSMRPYDWFHGIAAQPPAFRSDRTRSWTAEFGRADVIGATIKGCREDG